MANDRTFYFQVPNFIDDSDLSSSAFRLYCHLKRVCGVDANKVCTQSVRSLAKWCNMSPGTISKAKKELQTKGFIKIKEISTSIGFGHEIRLVDIWELNRKIYKEDIQDLPENNPVILSAKIAKKRYNDLKRQRTKFKLPKDFELTDEMFDWAFQNAPIVDADEATERFIEIMRSSGAEHSDWLDAWKGFIRNYEQRKNMIPDEIAYHYETYQVVH